MPGPRSSARAPDVRSRRQYLTVLARSTTNANADLERTSLPTCRTRRCLARLRSSCRESPECSLTVPQGPPELGPSLRRSHETLMISQNDDAITPVRTLARRIPWRNRWGSSRFWSCRRGAALSRDCSRWRRSCVRKTAFDANHLYGMSRHFVWLIPLANLSVFSWHWECWVGSPAWRGRGAAAGWSRAACARLRCSRRF